MTLGAPEASDIADSIWKRAMLVRESDNDVSDPSLPAYSVLDSVELNRRHRARAHENHDPACDAGSASKRLTLIRSIPGPELEVGVRAG